jgi:hypothetical protein
MTPEPLAILLGAIRALLLNESARSAVLPAYDAAGAQLIQVFHGEGYSAEELMALERNLQLLRDALREARR